MPLPQFNLYPAFNTVRLSHVEFIVKDLAASRAFYADLLGLQVTDEDSDTIYLRAMEERGHHCMILRKGETSAVSYLAMKVYAEEELDKAMIYFDAKGRKTEWVERPYQGRTLRTYDNFGIPLEFYYKMDRLAPIHQK